MLDKTKVRESFSRGARDYDKNAVLQKQLADELLAGVQALTPRTILDIGCGTGYLADRLAGKFPRADVFGIDTAVGMIRTAEKKYRRPNLNFLVGDGEEINFNAGIFDLIVSNASFQWMDAGKVFPEAARVSRPGGDFIFQTFGPGTLRELKAAGFRVNTFPSLAEIEALLRDKFGEVSLKSKIVPQLFRNAREIILHLYEIGAETAAKERARDFDIFKAFSEYKRRYGSAEGVAASYEVISGHYKKH
ncbi:MAG TPA: malonyl-ACP O-methyltransferase BioC [Candidatus Sulfotelmatobacter sp.]|nr:malonyl-ACP O-methyltransferase BioC [Candidatus Sulfotelmatobacter sp.]